MQRLSRRRKHIHRLFVPTLLGIAMIGAIEAVSRAKPQTNSVADSVADSVTMSIAKSAKSANSANSAKSTLVGRTVRFEQVVLEGPELEVRPITSATPVVMRIRAVYPHGSAHRYDIEAYALEPGDFDLCTFLREVGSPEGDGASVAADSQASDTGDDRTSRSANSPLRLHVESSLPDGQVEPYDLVSSQSFQLGGYRRWLIVGAVVWVVGLIGLLLIGRPRRRSDASTAAPPATTADRLREIVRDALDGHLEPEQHALLERLLVVHWREQLELTDMEPVEALAMLRAHPQAGELLRNLEDWLHRPDPPYSVDVDELLRPYLKATKPRADATRTDKVSGSDASNPPGDSAKVHGAEPSGVDRKESVSS